MGASKAALSPSDQGVPAASSCSPRTVESTDAACGPPITDTRAPGQSHKNLGE